MKRLLDEAATPLEERAASLLREVGPLEESDIARARVRRALERRPVRSRATGLGRLVGVIVFGAGAAAAAVWGGASLLSSSPAPNAPVEATTGDAGAKPRATGQRVGAPIAPQAVQEPELPKSKPSLPGRRSSEESARASSQQTAGRGAAQSSASDAVLVQQAMDALRNDGDADRATQLLEKYRKKGQNQALSEEALALSIEAALVKDPSRAKRLALQYLETYPRGRFKQLAERAAGH